MRRSSRACLFAATTALGCAGLMSLAGGAQAEELEFTFSDGRANLGSQQGVHIIDPAVPDPPATLLTSYAPATGAFTAPASGLSFPSKTIENVSTPLIPVDARADFAALGPISGTYDQATGVLNTTTLNIKATISVYPAGTPQTEPNLLTQCEISPVPLPFATSGQIVDQNDTPGNTADDIPYDGAPYVPGPGAVVATWASLPPSTYTGGAINRCSDVDTLLGGAGGIWLTGPAPTVGPDTCATVQSLCPVPPPPPSGGGTNTGTTPVLGTAAKKCKKGQKKKGSRCVKKKKKKK